MVPYMLTQAVHEYLFFSTHRGSGVLATQGVIVAENFMQARTFHEDRVKSVVETIYIFQFRDFIFQVQKTPTHYDGLKGSVGSNPDSPLYFHQLSHPSHQSTILQPFHILIMMLKPLQFTISLPGKILLLGLYQAASFSFFIFIQSPLLDRLCLAPLDRMHSYFHPPISVPPSS